MIGGSATPPRRATIVAWLVRRLAESANVDVCEVADDEPFAAYGIDSVAGVALSAELAEWLGIDLPSTLAWDFRTIDGVTTHVLECLARAPAQQDGP